jgi:hypothetical protein
MRLWPCDDHPYTASKWIGSNPSLLLLFDVPAFGLDSSFNPLAACGRVLLQSKTRRGIWTLGQRNPKANGLVLVLDKPLLSLFCHNLSL